MRKLLNTLYVTTPEAYLSKDGLNVVISVQQEEVFRIPVINIEGIVTFGYMGASPGVMKLCSDNGISLTFLSPQGRFISRVQGATKGNVLLRKKQYQLSDDASWSLHVVRLMIGGKIQNYRNILRRYIRDYGENEDINRAVQVLERAKRDALKAQDKTELIGYEGMASNAYFEVLPILILNQKTDFPFHGRNRRPPKDAVNAMLSFAYTLIANDVAAALETVGLDPYVGFLHTLRPGRTSLAPYLSRSASRSYWFHSAGRGPMTAISPTRIFHSWGSSSRLVLRRKCPMRVIYCSGSCSRWVGISCGVSMRIVRNLRIWKCRLPMPTRFCRKNTGPGESSLMATAKSSSSHERHRMPQADSKISSSRLIRFRYINPTSSVFYGSTALL